MTDRQLVNQNDATGAADYAQMAQASLAGAQAAWAENAALMTGLPVEWSPAADADVDVFVGIVAQAALNAVTGGASSFKSAAATMTGGARGAANSLEIVSTVRQEMTVSRPKKFATFDIVQPGKTSGQRQSIGPMDYFAKRELGDRIALLDGSMMSISGLKRGFDQPPTDTKLMQQIRRRLEEPTEDLNTGALKQGSGVAPAEISRLFSNGDNRVKMVVEDNAPKSASPLAQQKLRI